MTGVAKHTVLRLLKDMGCAGASYHDTYIRNVKAKRIQYDEIWSFVYAKNITQDQWALTQMIAGHGAAIDADTKVIVS